MKVLIDLNTLKKNPVGAVSIRMQGPIRLIRETWWTHMGHTWYEHAQAGPNGEWLPNVLYEIGSVVPNKCIIRPEFEYLTVTDERPSPAWAYAYLYPSVKCDMCGTLRKITYNLDFEDGERVCEECDRYLAGVPHLEFETVEEALARLPKP